MSTPGGVTHEYDPTTGLNWITIDGPVTTCLVCHRLLAGDAPFVCETCDVEEEAEPTDAELTSAYPPRGHGG